MRKLREITVVSSGWREVLVINIVGGASAGVFMSVLYTSHAVIFGKEVDFNKYGFVLGGALAFPMICLEFILGFAAIGLFLGLTCYPILLVVLKKIGGIRLKGEFVVYDSDEEIQ